MQFKKSLLVRDLGRCMPGIAVGQISLDGADCFVFENNYVHTYNSAISISEKLSQEFPNGVVNAVDFYNAIQKFPTDDCELNEVSSESGNSWLITCGKIRLTINLLDSKDIMERFNNILPDESSWLPLDGKEFQSQLRLCFMPGNKSKFSGIMFKGDDLLSTDGWQINKGKLGVTFPKFVWINNDAVRNLMGWDSFTALQVNKTWLQFKTEQDLVFSVKMLYSESVPIDTILSSIQKIEAMENIGSGTFTEAFFKAIDRASGFSQKVEDYDNIELLFDENGVTVRSHKVSGAYEELVEDVKSSVKVRTHVDPSMLLSTKGKVAEFTVFRGTAVAGKEPPIRFEFKTDNFLSIIASMQ